MRLCEFSGCGKKHFGKGYCRGHYGQLWKGQDLRPLINRGVKGEGIGWRNRNYAKFGMNEGEYEEMVVAQCGQCAICGDQCSSGRRLAIDHDHESGFVRGLLCMNCNNALGKFKDDERLLLAAIDYLADARRRNG